MQTPMSTDPVLPDMQAAYDAMVWLHDAPAAYDAAAEIVEDQPSDHGYDFYDC